MIHQFFTATQTHQILISFYFIQEGFTNSWGQRSVLGLSGNQDKDPDFNFKDTNAAGSISAPSTASGAGSENFIPGTGRKTSTGSINQENLNHQRNIDMRDVLHTPQEILA